MSLICPGTFLNGIGNPDIFSPVIISLVKAFPIPPDIFSPNCPAFSIPFPAIPLATSNPCPSFSPTCPAIFPVIGNTDSVSLRPFPIALPKISVWAISLQNLPTSVDISEPACLNPFGVNKEKSAVSFRSFITPLTPVTPLSTKSAPPAANSPNAVSLLVPGKDPGLTNALLPRVFANLVPLETTPNIASRAIFPAPKSAAIAPAASNP